MPRDDFSNHLDAEAGLLAESGGALRNVPAGHRAMAALEAYWRDIKGRDLLPRRRDLDASRIEEVLPHAFILERIAPGVARLRTGGQILCGHLGFDARGMPLSVLFSATARNQLRRLIDHCFDDPALVDVTVAAPRGLLQPPVRGRLLLLPLLDQEDRVTRAVGGLFLNEPARLSKVRFDLIPDATLRCEKLSPAVPALQVVSSNSIPLASRIRSRPNLRLVASNP